MNFAWVKEGKCTNVVILDQTPSEEEKSLFIPNYCDEIVRLEEGFGIGDIYNGTEWVKTIKDPSVNEKVERLETENKLLKAQIQAQTDRSDFVEECIAEMATLVYV